MASGNVTAIHRRAWFLRRRSPGDVVFDVCNGAFLIIFCLTIIYPFWTTLLTSFADERDVTSLGFKIWIDSWNAAAYRFSFSSYGSITSAYFNSILRAVVATVLTMIVTMLGAYPLSKRNLPWRNVLTIYVLITMFFSGGLIPTYLLVRGIGLLNTRWALFLPFLAQGFYIIIVRNFLMTIDEALEESAFIDGANYLQVLLRIILPLSKPVLATVALWTAVWHWNEWFYALIYTSGEEKIVLQLIIRRMIQDISLDTVEAMNAFGALDERPLPSAAVRAAVTILTIGPIILVYPFIQRHFIKGIFFGSLKG